jgi:hypothetical protein
MVFRPYYVVGIITVSWYIFCWIDHHSKNSGRLISITTSEFYEKIICFNGYTFYLVSHQPYMLIA